MKMKIFVSCIMLMMIGINVIQLYKGHKGEIHLGLLNNIAFADSESGNGKWRVDLYDEISKCYDCVPFMDMKIEKLCDCIRSTWLCIYDEVDGYLESCQEQQNIILTDCVETGELCVGY